MTTRPGVNSYELGIFDELSGINVNFLKKFSTDLHRLDIDLFISTFS